MLTFGRSALFAVVVILCVPVSGAGGQEAEDQSSGTHG